MEESKENTSDDKLVIYIAVGIIFALCYGASQLFGGDMWDWGKGVASIFLIWLIQPKQVVSFFKNVFTLNFKNITKREGINVSLLCVLGWFTTHLTMLFI